MDKTILKASKRTEKPNELRRTGFLPGVLYGKSFENAISIKFEESFFNKIINAHGPNAKLEVELDGKNHFGYIKQLQRNCLNGKVIHADIHAFSREDKIKVKLPISFSGTSKLEQKQLLLHINKDRVNVFGKAGSIPEYITVQVDELELGANIKIEDLNLSEDIKVLDSEDEVYASVAEIKKLKVELEPEATEGEGIEGTEELQNNADKQEDTAESKAE